MKFHIHKPAVPADVVCGHGHMRGQGMRNLQRCTAGAENQEGSFCCQRQAAATIPAQQLEVVWPGAFLLLVCPRHPKSESIVIGVGTLAGTVGLAATCSTIVESEVLSSSKCKMYATHTFHVNANGKYDHNSAADATVATATRITTTPLRQRQPQRQPQQQPPRHQQQEARQEQHQRQHRQQ